MQDYILRMLLIAPPILLALTVHECAHAWVASKMGDPTAKMLGRITLNPIKHLDPLGTLALFLTQMFGWAKPVPINPRNFHNISKGLTLVSLAGPASNLMLAALSAIVYKVFVVAGSSTFAGFESVYRPLFIMVELSVILNVSLAVFNMIPIPPLDGSKVLANLLPPDKAFQFSRIEPYGFMILIVLMMTGVIGRIISPLIFLMVGLLTGEIY